jgi:hypothetical protein
MNSNKGDVNPAMEIPADFYNVLMAMQMNQTKYMDESIESSIEVEEIDESVENDKSTVSHDTMSNMTKEEIVPIKSISESRTEPTNCYRNVSVGTETEPANCYRNVSVGTETEPVNESTNESTNERKKRGLPRSMLINQIKYMEAMEKQQRMNGSNNKNDKKKKIPFSETKSYNVPSTNTSETNGRRMIVNGKVKYIPIAQTTNADSVTITTESPININKNLSNIGIKSETPGSTPTDSTDETPQKKIPSSIAKKMEIYNAKMEKQNRTCPKNKTQSSKTIPPKYAQQIEKDAKKSTMKNVKNFSELRKVKMMENLDINIDANKTSITELRKMKMEQRKNEMLEAKKRLELNKKESAVKTILADDKMSKFAKTVAIKNLSVNSRNGKNNKVRKDSIVSNAN